MTTFWSVFLILVVGVRTTLIPRCWCNSPWCVYMCVGLFVREDLASLANRISLNTRAWLRESRNIVCARIHNAVPKGEPVISNNGMTFQQRFIEASRPRRPKQRPSLPVEARGRTRVGEPPGRRIGTEDGSMLLAVCGSHVDSSVNKDRRLTMAEAAAGDLLIQSNPATSYSTVLSEVDRRLETEIICMSDAQLGE